MVSTDEIGTDTATQGAKHQARTMHAPDERVVVTEPESLNELGGFLTLLGGFWSSFGRLLRMLWPRVPVKGLGMFGLIVYGVWLLSRLARTLCPCIVVVEFGMFDVVGVLLTVLGF